MLSRILHGTRGTLQIGLISIMLGGFGGAIIGVIGAYFRRVDLVIMRIVDVLLSFPSVLVALALAGVLGPGQLTLTIALAVAAFPSATRIARSAALTVVHREYVESARAVGLRTRHILLRYVLRNCGARGHRLSDASVRPGHADGGFLELSRAGNSTTHS